MHLLDYIPQRLTAVQLQLFDSPRIAWNEMKIQYEDVGALE